jgi:chaperone modulatory protein CbpM
MVEIGIIEPRGEQPSDWRFTALTVFRSRKALRLQRDLEINLQGVAVALDLMDEVDSLRDRVNSLQQQLGKLQR